MRHKHIFLCTLLVVFGTGLIGCGVQSARDAASGTATAPAEKMGRSGQETAGADVARFSHRTNVESTNNHFALLGFEEAVVNTASDPNRKIVYNAHVELAVEDFTGVPDQVIALVKQYDAYVANSNLSGLTGETRRATWTIRVPVERFEDFVGAAKGLGDLQRVSTTSRDVSEEYYDVEARIRNKTKEEARLLELLENRPGELKDVIAIERELSRVRGELERMQGRMRVLADLTSLTTVDLSITEIRDFQPPESPTLATRTRRSFEGSLSSLQAAGESLLIGAVASTPWLPVAAVVVAPAYLVARRVRRSDRRDRTKETEK